MVILFSPFSSCYLCIRPNDTRKQRTAIHLPKERKENIYLYIGKNTINVIYIDLIEFCLRKKAIKDNMIEKKQIKEKEDVFNVQIQEILICHLEIECKLLHL